MTRRFARGQVRHLCASLVAPATLVASSRRSSDYFNFWWGGAPVRTVFPRHDSSSGRLSRETVRQLRQSRDGVHLPFILAVYGATTK